MKINQAIIGKNEKKRLNYYLLAAGIDKDPHKRAIFLHFWVYMSRKFLIHYVTLERLLQRLFLFLGCYFLSKKNFIYEHYLFMSARQLKNETIESCVTRLRPLGTTYDYNNSNEMIGDHAAMSCIYVHLRQCILRKPNFNLEFLKNIARVIELSKNPASCIESSKSQSSGNSVNKVLKTRQCYRCEAWGHIASEQESEV